MSDSENAPATIDFDTWRQAINTSLEGPKKYLAFAKPLGLPPAATALSEEFSTVVNQQLDGIDPDSQMARDIRDALSFAHDICPDPWRAAFISWSKENAALPALIAKAKAHPEQFTYHGFIGDVCEKFGQALLEGEHPVLSNFYRKDAPNEVKYRTRTADGIWHEIKQDDIVAMARDPNGPQVVYCGNHAFLDTQKFDLDKLQDEFARLFDGSRLPVARDEATKDTGHLSVFDKASLGPSDTVTVFATHTRENRFLNLAQLFKRLDEVDHHQDNPKEDSFEHLAPIAAKTVETLLKSIVVDEDVGKIKFDRDAQGKPSFFTQPITLREDAVDIIRRQRYRGFSKAGNDFRDAMRLLVQTLDNQAAITVPSGFTTKDLISNVSMIVFGLNEKPMAEYYRDHGVHVPMVSSKNDTTAPIPPFEHHDQEPVYNYHGDTAKDADGNIIGDGHTPWYSVDGMLKDWRILDLLRMHGAISQGQAAITDVNLVPTDGGGYEPNVLTLEVAQGTTDAMMEKVVEPLNYALRAAGLADTTLKLEADTQSRARYRLQNNDNTTKLVTPENIEKVQAVFRSLATTHNEATSKYAGERPEMPLWVSEAAAYEKISGIKRYLTLETKGKLEQKTPYPVTVINPASVTERMRYTNVKGVREHALTQRNLAQHTRIASVPNSGQQQVG